MAFSTGVVSDDESAEVTGHAESVEVVESAAVVAGRVVGVGDSFTVAELVGAASLVEVAEVLSWAPPLFPSAAEISVGMSSWCFFLSLISRGRRVG